MNQFKKLPSGTYLNLNSVQTVYYHMDGVRFCFSSSERDYFDEDMTAEQLDDLLRGPAIVDPVINLDKLKENAACQFTYEGKVKHGVIEEIGCFGESFIGIRSDGEIFTLWPSDGEVNLDSFQ